MNSKRVGEITEAAILNRLIQKGYSVSIPFGNNQRYDLIIDKGEGILIKAQCKTSRLRNGVLKFNACSQNGFTYKRKSYVDEVDVFLVYNSELDKYYEVPVENMPINVISLRVSEPHEFAPKSNIRWAKDYEI